MVHHPQSVSVWLVAPFTGDLPRDPAAVERMMRGE
jgi:hypothetical protein